MADKHSAQNRLLQPGLSDWQIEHEGRPVQSKGGRAADDLPSKKTGLPSNESASLRRVMTDGPLARRTHIRRVISTVREAIQRPQSQAGGWLGDRQDSSTQSLTYE